MLAADSLSQRKMLSSILHDNISVIPSLSNRTRSDEANELKLLFNRYHAPEIASLLVKNRNSLNDLGDIVDATVCYADIRNFTTLVQELHPHVLRRFLNGFFECLSEVIESNHGTIDKFIGDAALALFGVHSPGTDSKRLAFSAACNVIEQFEALKNSWISQESCFNSVGIGIGISHGPVFIGNVGSHKRFDYTVLGADVNIAQRLAANSKSGEILMTSAVGQVIHNDCPLPPHSMRTLRGFTGEFAIYSHCRTH